MYATDTILTFGFPLGRLCGARFRISYLFPLVAVAFIWQLQSIEIGMLAAVILLCSVLMHELGHLLVARSVGGEMDEIQLWPLGGLAEPFGRGFLKDHARTLLAGPLVNLLLALSCSLTLSSTEMFSLLNPFNGLPSVVDEPLVTTACRLVFYLNVILFSVNLIPITPFDGGVLLRTYMSTRFPEVESRDLMVRLGLVCSILGLLTGFVFGLTTVVAVSAFVLVLQIHDSLRWYEAVNANDDFAEYDFDWPNANGDEGPSEPFADSLSLSQTDDDISRSDVLERWRQQREQERLEREDEERRVEEEAVDNVLEKLHVHGRESLSPPEIHLLNRVSDRYRNRQQHH